VATDDNSAPDGKNASISFTAAAGGVYRIEVLVESGEGEYLLTAEHSVPDLIAPRVTSVLVASPEWTGAFYNYLASHGLGVGGYAIPVGNGVQLQTLPWTNIRQIKVRFSEGVIVAADDLVVTGVNVANYAVPAAGFSYDPATFTGTWTLGANLNPDKLLLSLNSSAATGVRDAAGNALDGEWDNPTGTGDPSSDTFPSGNGSAGGHFRFRVNVLPGDTSGNNRVFFEDLTDTLFRIGANTSSPRYRPRNDVDGSGAILLGDQLAIIPRFFNTLPGGNPAVPPFLAPAPIAADLVFAAVGSGQAPADLSPNPLAFLEDTLDELAGAKKKPASES
jgi:hypothetical protein